MWQVDDVTIAASTSGHPQILGLGTMHTLSRHNLGTMHDPRTRQINARFILNEKVKRAKCFSLFSFFSGPPFSLLYSEPLLINTEGRRPHLESNLR